MRGNVVLRHAPAGLIRNAEIKLRHGIALLAGLAPPLHSFCIVSPTSLRIPHGISVVAVTPDREISTRKAREVLPLSISRAEAVFNLQLAADEAAKRAIAEELHGAVQTKLYAVWMKLGAVAEDIRDSVADQDEVVAAIADDVDLIREEDIRQLSHRLHPGIVRELSGWAPLPGCGHCGTTTSS